MAQRRPIFLLEKMHVQHGERHYAKRDKEKESTLCERRRNNDAERKIKKKRLYSEVRKKEEEVVGTGEEGDLVVDWVVSLR